MSNTLAEEPVAPDGAHRPVGSSAQDTPAVDAPAPSPLVEVISAPTATFMVMAITVLIVGLLGFALWSAEQSYGSGIALVTQAKGYDPTSAARRIFLLAGGMQITMFKVIAFGISTLLALVGGVFILNGSTAAYQLNLSKGDAGGALVSTSPGLVIMTLAMGLAAFTLNSKSDISDHTDMDVQRPVIAKAEADAVDAAAAAYIKQAQAELPTESAAPPSGAAAPNEYQTQGKSALEAVAAGQASPGRKNDDGKNK
jgi:hypothetical protein